MIPHIHQSSLKSIDLLMLFPSGGQDRSGYFGYNLGSGYIIAYLHQNGFTAEQLYSTEPLNVSECIKKIGIFNPKVVGFTVFNTNYISCVLIAEAIKKYDSKTVVVFGGPTPTVIAEKILIDCPSVDICLRGPGEEILLSFLTAFQKNGYNLQKTPLTGLPNLSYRNRQKIIHTPGQNILGASPVLKDCLDKYPSPYLTGVIPAAEAYNIGIISARGCNQNCIYCNCAILNNNRIFLHSIDRVLEELAFISEHYHGFRPVPIQDDTFTLLPNRAREIFV